MLDAPQPQISVPIPPAQQEPIAPLNPPTPNWRRWVSRFRRPVVYLTFFLVIFAIMHWLTPYVPSSTIVIADEGIWDFRFSPDSSVIAVFCSEDLGDTVGITRVWDVKLTEERYAINTVKHGWMVFSSDGTFFASRTKEWQVKVWKTETGEEVSAVKPQSQGQEETFWMDFAFSPDTRFLVLGDRHGHIAFVKVGDVNASATMEADYLVFSPDGNSAATNQSKEDGSEVVFWRIPPNGAPKRDKRLFIPSNSIALSPDLKTIAAIHYSDEASSGIALWDVATGAKQSLEISIGVKDLDARCWHPTFGGNGRILVAHYARRAHLRLDAPAKAWDVSAIPKEIGEYGDPPTVSPNGNWLAVPVDGGAQLIKTSTGEKKARLVNQNDRCGNFPGNIMRDFSPDGKMIAVSKLNLGRHRPFFADWLPAGISPFDSGYHYGARLWDLGTGQELMAVEKCNQIHFSPDGKYLATEGEGNVINLWRLPLRKPLWLILLWTVLVVAAGWAMIWLVRRVRLVWQAMERRFRRVHPAQS